MRYFAERDATPGFPVDHLVLGVSEAGEVTEVPMYAWSARDATYIERAHAEQTHFALHAGTAPETCIEASADRLRVGSFGHGTVAPAVPTPGSYEYLLLTSR